MDNRPLESPFAVKIAAYDLFVGGVCCVSIPRAAIKLVTGALAGLTNNDSWSGDASRVNLTIDQIHELIVMLTECDACNGRTGENGQIIMCGGGSCSGCEDCDMGNCVTDITFEDGVLYKHYGACCKVPVENWGAQIIINQPPGDTNTDPGTPPTYACNKAYGMAGALVTLAQDVVAAISPYSSVYEMYQPAHAVLSPQGSTWQTSQLVCAAYIAASAEIDANVASGDTQQWLACTWSPVLQNTDNLSGAEFDAILVSQVGGFSDAEKLFWLRMITAVGQGTMAWWSRLFYSADAETCDCPSPETYSGLVWWENTRTIELESQGASLFTAARDSINEMRFTVFGGLNANFQEVHWRENLSASATIQELEVKIFNRSTSDVPDYFPAEDWSDTNPTSEANYVKAVVEGVTAPDTVSYITDTNEITMVSRWNSPINLDAGSVAIRTKLNPKNQAVNQQAYRVQARITYAGPLR